MTKKQEKGGKPPKEINFLGKWFNYDNYIYARIATGGVNFYENIKMVKKLSSGFASRASGLKI